MPVTGVWPMRGSRPRKVRWAGRVIGRDPCGTDRSWQVFPLQHDSSDMSLPVIRENRGPWSPLATLSTLSYWKMELKSVVYGASNGLFLQGTELVDARRMKNARYRRTDSVQCRPRQQLQRPGSSRCCR